MLSASSVLSAASPAHSGSSQTCRTRARRPELPVQTRFPGPQLHVQSPAHPSSFQDGGEGRVQKPRPPLLRPRWWSGSGAEAPPTPPPSKMAGVCRVQKPRPPILSPRGEGGPCAGARLPRRGSRWRWALRRCCKHCIQSGSGAEPPLPRRALPPSQQIPVNSPHPRACALEPKLHLPPLTKQ